MMGVINGFPTDVGSILVRMGVCSEDQVKTASEKGPPEIVLVASGEVSEADVHEAERLQTSLRSAREMPVVALVRLYNHAVGNYHRNTLRLSEVLEGLSKR